MPNRPDRMTLVAFADPNAFHAGDPAAQRGADRFALPAFVAHAKLAERAGFDAIFKPDFLGFDTLTDEVRPRAPFEPLTLLTALSQHTSRVGLIITESTSFTEPYNIARYFTSLDHLSGGRASWNIVTSYYGEENFGDGKLLPLAERYKQADEFLEVTNRLWNSWKPGAVSYDPQAGHRFDGALIEPLNFTGRYFQVKQALDIAPGPQRRPVMVQAGASEEGLDFAARHAEIVFAAAPDIDTGIAFYRDLKGRVARAGRDPDRVRILPGLNIFVAATERAAEDIYQSQFTDRNLLKYRDKVVREAPLFKLEGLELDEAIPAHAIPSEAELERVERRRSRGLLLRQYFSRPGTTLRQALSRAYEFGHLTLIGTPASVATELTLWFENHAADGFVLKGGNSFPTVADGILPILAKGGVLQVPRGQGLTFRQTLFAPRVPA